MKQQTHRILVILVGIAIILLFGLPMSGQASPPAQGPQPFDPHKGGSASSNQKQGTPGLGALPSSPDLYPPKLPPHSRIQSQRLATSVDLTSKMPPVGDQGSQGSCVAWATGYYYKTFHEGLQHGWDLTTSSHQFSPAFLYNQRLNSKCQIDRGWYGGSAFQMLQEKGDVSIASFPYNQNDTCTQPTPSQLQSAPTYRASDFGAFFINSRTNVGNYNNSLSSLKQELANGNMIVFMIPIYDEFYNLDDSASPGSCTMGIPSPSSQDWGGHAISIIGYNETTQRFKFRNSWGTSWGCNGDAYLSYDFVEDYVHEAWWMNDFPTDNPQKVYLPVVTSNYSSVTQPGLYGQVTQNGTPAKSAYIELRKSYKSGEYWYSYQLGKTYTNVNGIYRFSGLGTLGNDERYYVNFINDTHTSGQLWRFTCNAISSYTAGTDQQYCNFDIADIPLGSPTGTINLPRTFYWTARTGYSSDDYEFNLYDKNGDDWLWTHLGYTDHYTLESLPEDFRTGEYYWDLWFYASNGYGWTLGANKVKVSSKIEILNFKVRFEGRDNSIGRFQNVPIKVKIKNQAGDQTLFESDWTTVTPSSSSNNWGIASVDVSSASLMPGQTYQVFIKGAMYLAKRITTSLTSDQTIDYTDMNLNPPGYLLGGDIDQDNYVDTTDLQTLILYWGQTPPINPEPSSPVYRCDLDGDGNIGVNDERLLVSSWGMSGDPY